MLGQSPEKGAVLTDGRTTLIRQIHEKVIKDGNIVGFEIFMPRPKDNKLLSVDNGDVNPWFVAFMNFYRSSFPTVGCARIHVSDCTQLKLPVIADPSMHNRAHTLIDMRSCTTDRQIKEKAKRLYLAALNNNGISLSSDFMKLPEASDKIIIRLDDYTLDYNEEGD